MATIPSIANNYCVLFKTAQLHVQLCYLSRHLGFTRFTHVKLSDHELLLLDKQRRSPPPEICQKGDFKGMYVLTERVKRGKYRVGVSKIKSHLSDPGDTGMHCLSIATSIAIARRVQRVSYLNK